MSKLAFFLQGASRKPVVNHATRGAEIWDMCIGLVRVARITLHLNNTKHIYICRLFTISVYVSVWLRSF
jgi:hypothetical protein